MIKLRAHHLICMCQFQGLGYSKEFAKNMTVILQAIQDDPTQKVLVVDHMDDICSACPNRISDTVCARSNDGCIHKDRSALNVLGLQSGNEYVYLDILNMIKAHSESVYDTCCKNCSWEQKGVCSLALFKSHLHL